MSKRIDLILKEQLKEIELPEKIKEEMDFYLGDILRKIKKRKEKLNLDVEIFVGGSYAKKTLIKKDKYDIDLFLRFSKKYLEKDFKKLTKKLLRRIKKVSIVHGSRDYFQIKITKNITIEVIPVRKIKNPKEAENITDLSYSHVKYIKEKQSKEILEQIKIAKSFCSATKTYGAESYIHGFSGYALELLIINYKTFEKMLKELTKTKNKIIIDLERYYKNKNEILINLNGSKLSSPIILIDPTYSKRNATAAISSETFEKFQEKAKEFLKNPSKEMFKQKEINLEEIKENATKNNLDFIKLKIKTNKPKGDIAGTKLLKFYKHLSEEIKKYYELMDSEFNYLKNKEGVCFFVLKRKKEIIFQGPKLEDKESLKKFKLEHKEIKNNSTNYYALEELNFSIESFIKNWKKKNKKKIKEMYIRKIEIIK